MARLSERERLQLQEAAQRVTPKSPPVPTLSPQNFVAFATQASNLHPVRKPLRFGGNHWKL